MTEATFTVLADGTSSRVQTHSEIVKIGRRESCQLRLDDPAVSNMHCVLEIAGQSVLAIDLGAEPQTRLNGALLIKQHLSPGDRLEFGNTVVVFEGLVGATPQASIPHAAKPNPTPGGAAPAAVHPSPTKGRLSPEPFGDASSKQPARGSPAKVMALLVACVLMLVIAVVGYVLTRG